MNRTLRILALSILGGVVCSSCQDHDDPELAPIDTTQVKVTANVKQLPQSSWLSVSDELTVRVSDLSFSAPKGVVLRSISLIGNNGLMSFLIDDKPYSGESLEFKVPLTGKQGRLNMSLRGNLIRKDSRDAEVIIADNIQTIVFSEMPEFMCDGWLMVGVESKSTSGEEYSRRFEVRSGDNLSIAIPRSELYWTPAEGTAQTLELTLGSGATAWSPNTSFDCSIVNTALGHSSGDAATMKLTIPNVPGSLDKGRLQLYVLTSYYGTWENVTITPYNLTSVFGIYESE
ncbi:MAG: hypothetical protein K2M88_09135 [Muribaculaceae bacterium]|nr:hypothetical protein [Muribaculaceae bacterium]